MEKKTSQVVLAVVARSISVSGSASSNQTTSGRKRPPQFGHLGGTSPVSLKYFYDDRAFIENHFVREMFPCSSMKTRVFPGALMQAIHRFG